MAAIAAALRRDVIARARGYCEYCRAPLDVVVEMEIDHVIPVAAGGETTLDNLCLACAGCNRYKSAFQDGTDPDSGEVVPLFDPRREVWAEHFVWADGGARITGRTATGRATVERLRMNRDRMLIARRLWAETGLFPPDED